MLSIDVRDFAWWERKARIENVKKKINELSAIRLAMHGEESFGRQVRDLLDLVEMWERPKWTDEEVMANWTEQMAALKGLKEDIQDLEAGKKIRGGV